MKRFSLMSLLVAAAVIALPSLVLADTITFSAPTINLTESNSNQTGYFDVLISNTADNNTEGTNGSTDGSGASETSTNGQDIITSFTVDLSTTANIFAGGSDQTDKNGQTVPYIYEGATYNSHTEPANSSTDSGYTGAGTNLSNGPGNQWMSDDGNSNTATILYAGTALGLLQVEYVIPGMTTGSYPLYIGTPNTDYANQNVQSIWSDTWNNNNVPAVVNGAINIVAAPTPEPSSLVLLVLGAVGLFGIRRLRSR